MSYYRRYWSNTTLHFNFTFVCVSV